MADANNSKHKDYARYAALLLEPRPRAQRSARSCCDREMAAEWLRLADAALEPLKRVPHIRSVL